ncbi:MAG: hypothetical protein KIT83_17305 [Bryobacterales bacterium]|nr:hypothetical protein [Bryobacterales bacterium]
MRHRFPLAQCACFLALLAVSGITASAQPGTGATPDTRSQFGMMRVLNPVADAQAIEEAARLLPPEMSVAARLRLAGRGSIGRPAVDITELRDAFADAVQARQPHRMVMVDAGAAAAVSLEGYHSGPLDPSLDTLSLQTQAIRIAARVNLEEALRWLPYLPRQPETETRCSDFLLPDTSARFVLLTHLGGFVWRLPHQEDATRVYRQQLLEAAVDELATVRHPGQVGPALSLVSATHWNPLERGNLLAVLAASISRTPALPRVPADLYRNIHQHLLRTPSGGDPQAAMNLAEAVRGLFTRQVEQRACLTEDGQERDADARVQLQRILDGSWEFLPSTQQVQPAPLPSVIVTAREEARLLDAESREGFQVTPIWIEDESLAILDAIRATQPRPALVIPTVTGPDGAPRPFPFSRAPKTGPVSTASQDWEGLSQRFARYREQQDRLDLAAFHRIAQVWTALITAQPAGPGSAREWLALGEYLEGSPVFREHPAHWVRQARSWLLIRGRFRELSLEQPPFPRLQAWYGAYGLSRLVDLDPRETYAAGAQPSR